MSWDLQLVCDHCQTTLVDQNYTHNTNPMMNEAHGRDGHWLDLIHGSSGPEGAQLLMEIVHAFDAQPERFRSMNPLNGWGDMDQLRDILADMAASVPEAPTTWEVASR